MKSRIIILLGLGILLVAAFALRDGIRSVVRPPSDTTPPVSVPGDQVACTMDAKMCPDGSYVGRVGPDCQFAACPVGSTSGNTFEARLGQSSSLMGFSVTLTEVVEDSRCPTDVVCIQAGTVRVRGMVHNMTTEQIFVLNKPVIIDLYSIELIQVTPSAVSSKTINKEDYRFTFKITETVPEPM